MPAGFDRCRRRNGKIVTVKPNKGTYIHVCYPQGGGAPIQGEAKHNKESK